MNYFFEQTTQEQQELTLDSEAEEGVDTPLSEPATMLRDAFAIRREAISVPLLNPYEAISLSGIVSSSEGSVTTSSGRS